MDKFSIFREMLDYMAHIGDVIDADMNYCGNIIIECKNDSQEIVMEVIIKDKEEEKDGN